MLLRFYPALDAVHRRPATVRPQPRVSLKEVPRSRLHPDGWFVEPARLKSAGREDDGFSQHPVASIAAGRICNGHVQETDVTLKRSAAKRGRCLRIINE